MTTPLSNLAALVGGQLTGDPNHPIRAAKPVGEAGINDITFLEHDKYLTDLADGSAGAAVVPMGIQLDGRNLIRVSDAFEAFLVIAQHLCQPLPDEPPAIDPRATIHPSATIGVGARIEAFAVVGAHTVIGRGCRLAAGSAVGRQCRLGDDVTLKNNVVVYDRTIIGDRVTIHANSVIGADGFGYRVHNGRHVKVPQLGWVEIGDDVEIGSCTTIDRGTFTATRIGSGTKIDNLVMIAHNCQVGRHNIFVSQMGMAGSSSTGDYVVIAGQVGVVDHVHIGDRSVIGGQAAVTKDVAPDSRMLGSPATPAKEQMRILMSLQHLPEFRKEFRLVQERLGLAG